MAGEAFVVAGAGSNCGWLKGVARIGIKTSELAGGVTTLLRAVAVSLPTAEDSVF